MYTVETETELYNRLVPWGTATHLRSSSVKFSPSVCVAVVVSLTGEMAAQSYAYHAHETANSDKSCCYSWFVCHDKTSKQQCIARSGSIPSDESSY